MAKKPPVPGEFDGISAPARRALANAGIKTLMQLAGKREADVTALHGMGPNALGKLHDKLKAKKLSFAK